MYYPLSKPNKPQIIAMEQSSIHLNHKLGYTNLVLPAQFANSEMPFHAPTRVPYAMQAINNMTEIEHHLNRP